VSTRAHKLTRAEIQGAFPAGTVPQILSPKQLANLIGISPKTLAEWLSKGRLDGAFRKRGKHVLFWRDRALDIIFNGKEWKNA